jgi:hypothetical protein
MCLPKPHGAIFPKQFFSSSPTTMLSSIGVSEIKASVMCKGKIDLPSGYFWLWDIVHSKAMNSRLVLDLFVIIFFHNVEM